LTTADRFWSKVEKTEGFWFWRAALDQHGYGRFTRSTRDVVKAHRFSYESAIGPIPDGKIVCHKCDRPACVRPGHRFIGTMKDNTRDMMTKGRHRYETHPGETNNTAKLTEADVLEIRRLAEHTQLKALASQFGVTVHAIKDVVYGKSWKHLTHGIPVPRIRSGGAA